MKFVAENGIALPVGAQGLEFWVEGVFQGSRILKNNYENDKIKPAKK